MQTQELVDDKATTRLISLHVIEILKGEDKCSVGFAVRSILRQVTLVSRIEADRPLTV